MPLDRQQELINQYGEEHIYYAILSANNYIQNEQAKGKSVKVGAIYNTAIKAQTGWGHELMWQAKEQQKKQEKLQAQKEAKAREEAKQAVLQAEKTAEVKRKKEELHGYWNELSFQQKHDVKVASLNSCAGVFGKTLEKYFDNDDFQSLFNYRVALNLETHIQEVLFAADRQFVENAQSGMNEEDNIWAETDFEEISPETVKPVEIAVKNSKSNAERADELYKDCLLKLTKKVYTVEQFTAAKDSIQFFRDGVISEDDLMIILNA